MSLEVCSIHPDLKEAIHKFRFRREKNNAAIISEALNACQFFLEALGIVLPERHKMEGLLKINADSQDVVVESAMDVEDLENLKDHITETQPRFVLLSWVIHHKDGRTSYPMAFIFVTPRDCKPQLQMMYAGSYKHLTEECKLTKVFQIRDIEELDEEWIETNLAK